ncbi:hypothetical protein C8R47DRAFT_1260454 [Mycena vitilis]|nr:hypothetical protein C8R47DRAFT_1260454 [Mycena vitilis]
MPSFASLTIACILGIASATPLARQATCNPDFEGAGVSIISGDDEWGYTSVAAGTDLVYDAEKDPLNATAEWIVQKTGSNYIFSTGAHCSLNVAIQGHRQHWVVGLPTVAVITVYGYGFTVTVAVPFYGYGSGRVRHRKHRKITAVYGALRTVQRSNGDLKLCPSLTDKSMEDHGRSKMILRQNEYQRSEISPPRLRKPKYLNLNMAEMPEYDAKLSKSTR